MSKRSLPWLQFYPSDWLSDSVAGCCLAAQGLWFRMLFVAHNSQRYGYLEADAKAIPDEQLARRCGCVSVDEYRSLLAELFAAGVPSRTPEGTIYSRRMVRDQSERDATAERVRRYRERVACNASVTPMLQGEVRSQRSEVRGQRKESSPTPRFALPDWIPPETWNDFLEMRKAQRAYPTEKAKALLVRKLQKLKGEGQDPKAVLEQSIERSWKGLFEVKESNQQPRGNSNGKLAGTELARHNAAALGFRSGKPN